MYNQCNIININDILKHNTHIEINKSHNNYNYSNNQSINSNHEIIKNSIETNEIKSKDNNSNNNNEWGLIDEIFDGILQKTRFWKNNWRKRLRTFSKEARMQTKKGRKIIMRRVKRGRWEKNLYI